MKTTRQATALACIALLLCWLFLVPLSGATPAELLPLVWMGTVLVLVCRIVDRRRPRRHETDLRCLRSPRAPPVPCL